MCWDAKLAAMSDSGAHYKLRGTLMTGVVQSNELITNWDFWSCQRALCEQSPLCDSPSAGESCLHKCDSIPNKTGLNWVLFWSQRWPLSSGDAQCETSSSLCLRLGLKVDKLPARASQLPQWWHRALHSEDKGVNYQNWPNSSFSSTRQHRTLPLLQV